MKLYIGNLPLSVSNRDLERLFNPHGTVTSAQIVTNPDSGSSRGFGFVEMARDHAIGAIARLNGHLIDSHTLRVSKALPPTSFDKHGGKTS